MIIEMNINKNVIDNIVKNTTELSLVPVVEGFCRSSFKIGSVKRINKEEGLLIVDVDVMSESSFKYYSFSVNRDGGLIFVGLLESLDSFDIYENSNQDIKIFEMMNISVNKDGVSNANSLIDSGKVDKESSWSFTAEDGNKLLGSNNDWANYRKWFLGVRSGVDPETKQHYAYPFGKNGRVYRSGVIAIKQRSAQQGSSIIEDVASKLLLKIDK